MHNAEYAKQQAQQELEKIDKELDSAHPGWSEAAGVLGGGVAGAAASGVLLAKIGTVAGLSAPGITSGLAAAGGILGGGMAAGVVY